MWNKNNFSFMKIFVFLTRLYTNFKHIENTTIQLYVFNERKNGKKFIIKNFQWSINPD